MSVLIGDLMAVADERYGDGGERKRSKKRVGGKKRMDAGSGYVPGSSPGKSLIPTSRKRSEKWGTPLSGPEAFPRVEEPPRAGSLRTEGRLPPKLMGELSELDFLRKAMGMGMIVSKPWGDSYRYDFICDTNGKLWRVQVRSTEFRFGHRGYAVHASVYVGRKIVGLTPKDIDVLIGYIVSRDIWYVVPVRAFTPRKNLWFYPDGSKK